jgi:hypothetical protein
MTEGEFRVQLAALIKRHPCKADTESAEHEVWSDDFEGLLYESSDDQAKRALDLYQLHIQNDHAEVVP